jgi:hypothetical protein
LQSIANRENEKDDEGIDDMMSRYETNTKDYIFNCMLWTNMGAKVQKLNAMIEKQWCDLIMALIRSTQLLP